MTKLRLELKPGWSYKITTDDFIFWRMRNNIFEDDVCFLSGSASGMPVIEFSRPEDMTAFRLEFDI